MSPGLVTDKQVRQRSVRRDRRHSARSVCLARLFRHGMLALLRRCRLLRIEQLMRERFPWAKPSRCCVARIGVASYTSDIFRRRSRSKARFSARYTGEAWGHLAMKNFFSALKIEHIGRKAFTAREHKCARRGDIERFDNLIVHDLKKERGPYVSSLLSWLSSLVDGALNSDAICFLIVASISSRDTALLALPNIPFSALTDLRFVTLSDASSRSLARASGNAAALSASGRASGGWRLRSARIFFGISFSLTALRDLPRVRGVLCFLSLDGMRNS